MGGEEVALRIVELLRGLPAPVWWSLIRQQVVYGSISLCIEGVVAVTTVVLGRRLLKWIDGGWDDDKTWASIITWVVILVILFITACFAIGSAARVINPKFYVVEFFIDKILLGY